MRMITTAIVTAMILGGCASARSMMFYEKPGVSEEQIGGHELHAGAWLPDLDGKVAAMLI